MNEEVDEYDEVEDILNAVEQGDKDGIEQIFAQYPYLLDGDNYRNAYINSNGSETPLGYAALLKKWDIVTFIAKQGYKVGLNEQSYMDMEAMYKLIDYEACFGYDRCMIGRKAYGILRSYDYNVEKIKEKIILMRCIWHFGSKNEFSDLPGELAQLIMDFLWESRIALRE